MPEFKTLTQLFNYVWDTRPHKSEISGEPLLPKGHPQWHWQFLHVLAKQYIGYKFRPENILLGTVKEHETQDSIPFFIEKRNELRRQYYKEFYNKKYDS